MRETTVGAAAAGVGGFSSGSRAGCRLGQLADRAAAVLEARDELSGFLFCLWLLPITPRWRCPVPAADRRTALHISAAEGNLQAVRLLIEEGGADPEGEGLPLALLRRALHLGVQQRAVLPSHAMPSQLQCESCTAGCAPSWP